MKAVPAGAHEWVSFDDPGEERTWLVDVTFLESAWQCIYGRGCQGVLTEVAPELEQGCCSYGAHFTGEDDARRVEAAAAALTEEQWQFRQISIQRGGPLRGGKGRTVTTRLVDGACIFLNRPEHPSGAGCALHKAALDAGTPPLRLKPDVCWQLPLRRDESVGPDGHLTTTIGEWRRLHWGRGGADFAWWCTETADAFVGRAPVYETLRDELVEMMGDGAYELVARYLDARRHRAGGKHASEPAAPAPVRVPHPAVRRAKR
ncbi:MAG: hypothetical protein ACLPTB_06015 [Acidimicrobiales bacterium]